MASQLKLNEPAAGIADKKNFPTAIIGSGLGGLMAGACLARNGFPVTLFEQYHKLGGYAVQFKRNRFVFDVSLTSTVADGPVPALLDEAGVRDKVEAVLLPELLTVITPDFRLVYPQRNPEGIIALLAEKFPAEKNGISRFIKKIAAIDDGKESDSLRKLSLEEFLNQHVMDPRLKALLSVFSGRSGKSRAELSALFYARSSGALMRYGASYYKRRSQDFSNAFVDVIIENGGVVKKNADVSKILMEGDRVCGVRFQETQGYEDYETHEARAVIADINISDAVNMLPPDKIPAEFQAALNQCEPSVSMFNIWLGLNEDISRDIKAYHTFVSDSYDEAKNLRAINTCDPMHVPYYVTIYNNAYEGYQENPHSSNVAIRFLSSFEPWRQFADAYALGKKKEYNLYKDQITKILIERAQKQVIPGLSHMIKENVSGTPLTNKKFNRNSHGSVYGYEPCNCRIHGVTPPVNGLYFTGAWWEPGSGYDNVLQSGFMTVSTLLNDWAKGGNQ